MMKRRKIRLFALSSSFRLQASVLLQTRRAGSILPMTALKGLEKQTVSWSETVFDFIKTALQTLLQHVSQNRHTFERHAERPFALSQAKYPPAEWISLMRPDPR